VSRSSASEYWPRIRDHKVLQWGLAYLGAALALALAWYHGHRSVRSVSTREATIISLLVKAEGLLASVKDLPPSLSMDGYLSYALFLMGVGRPGEAIEVLTRLRQAEPLAPFAALLLQICYETTGDYAAADAEYEHMRGLGFNSEIVRGTAVVRAMARRDTDTVRKLAATTVSDVNSVMLLHLNDPKAALAELRRLFKDPSHPPETLRSVVIAQWAGYFGDPARSRWTHGACRASRTSCASSDSSTIGARQANGVTSVGPWGRTTLSASRGAGA
jgi:tetratricopeptide (TPR) repeat protein